MSKDLINGFARSIHERAIQIIDQEIFCNDSSFINDLIGEADEIPSALTSAFSLENFVNYFDKSPDTVQEFLDSCSDYDEEENWSETFEEKLHLAESLGFQIEPKTIYEYWRVSPSLGRRLIKLGEPVLENIYGYWWGRTCTGQCILMDGTIQTTLI